MSIVINISELSDTDNCENAYRITLAIERALKELGINYTARNKSWFTGEGRRIGFELEAKDD